MLPIEGRKIALKP